MLLQIEIYFLQNKKRLFGNNWRTEKECQSSWSFCVLLSTNCSWGKNLGISTVWKKKQMSWSLTLSDTQRLRVSNQQCSTKLSVCDHNQKCEIMKNGRFHLWGTFFAIFTHEVNDDKFSNEKVSNGLILKRKKISRWKVMECFVRKRRKQI